MYRCYYCDYYSTYEKGHRVSFKLYLINSVPQYVCSMCDDIHYEILDDYNNLDEKVEE